MLTLGGLSARNTDAARLPLPCTLAAFSLLPEQADQQEEVCTIHESGEDRKARNKRLVLFHTPLLPRHPLLFCAIAYRRG